MATINRYGEGDVVLSTDKVVTSTWSNNTNNLTEFYTSSIQATQTDPNSQGNFFFEIYNEPTSSVSASVQLSIGFGHRNGSGSKDFTNDTGSFGFSGTKVVYNQFRQLIYGDETQNFVFGSHTPDSIYVINVNRSRYRHNLKPGSLNLKLKAGGVSKVLALTDDSVTTTGSAVTTLVGRQFNIVSGSDGVMSGSNINLSVASGSFGLFYPDAGLIILNPGALSDATRGIPMLSPGVDSNTNNENIQKIHSALEHGEQFIVDSEERISSQYYFTRVKNFEFNYTTNPSFVDDQGNLNFTSMIDMPRVYISTVGLYNDNGDLLAVAKLSQPVAKDFTKEALIRVKLDY